MAEDEFIFLLLLCKTGASYMSEEIISGPKVS